ncbi:MAG: hypothetical protein LIO96_09425 [Lachnospiraceae bacterium]|nr:hypothetical protein [Lachnospiraceae bacterium]
MNKIELYGNLSLIFLAACIGLAVLAVILFFVLDIRSVFGYLTGRTAKRQIQQMEEESAQSGRLFRKTRSNMQYVDEHMKADMGISEAAAPGARKVENAVRSAKSAELMQSGGEQTAPSPGGNYTASRQQGGEEATSLLQDGAQATSLLQGGEQATSLLQNGEEATSLLQHGEEATSLLRNGEETTSMLKNVRTRTPGPDETTAYLEHARQTEQKKAHRSTNGTFKIEREIIMIHAEEVI